MDYYYEKYEAFVAGKEAYAQGTMTYEELQALYYNMWSADDAIDCELWEGVGHWAPSCWDRNLPAPLRKKARDIGRKFRTRLEHEWSEGKKCNILFGSGDSEYDLYLDSKDQHRILVAEYMRSLPNDDEDLVEYRALIDLDKEYRMPPRRPREKGQDSKPGEGKSRRARARRARRNREAAGK